jgi:hypothetical protein
MICWPVSARVGNVKNAAAATGRNLTMISDSLFSLARAAVNHAPIASAIKKIGLTADPLSRPHITSGSSASP